MTAGTEEGVKGMSPKQIKDATDALISAIPASGGGTASNIAWENGCY
jgi:formiminotetrahydrofolate cyclodeaminase